MKRRNYYKSKKAKIVEDSTIQLKLKIWVIKREDSKAPAQLNFDELTRLGPRRKQHEFWISNTLDKIDAGVDNLLKSVYKFVVEETSNDSILVFGAVDRTKDMHKVLKVVWYDPLDHNFIKTPDGFYKLNKGS